MNIFTFRWYLVFLIFWILGLGRSEHASVTLDLLCVSNAQGTPLIDDNVTNLCYYTMYNRVRNCFFVKVQRSFGTENT